MNTQHGMLRMAAAIPFLSVALGVLALAFVIPIRVPDAAKRFIPTRFADADKQFGTCEMQAIETRKFQQFEWYEQSGRYLYACMRAAGFDLKSIFGELPDEHCKTLTMQRIVLPECYRAIDGDVGVAFGACEVRAIEKMDYHQGDYD